MKMPFSKQEINDAQTTVIRENKLPHAYLRPLVFYGSEAMGLRANGLSVHVAVAGWEWPSYMSPEALELGIKVRTSSYTRHHVNITMCKAKSSGSYMNSMLALNEALSGGADEALLLDNEGYVAEGSGENVFVIRDGVLHTPELTSCLDGITRKSIIELAEERGYKVRERRITRDELYIADEAFFTGTAAEVTRSVSWTAASSARASVGRSPRNCSRCTSIWCAASPTSTRTGSPTCPEPSDGSGAPTHSGGRPLLGRRHGDGADAVRRAQAAGRLRHRRAGAGLVPAPAVAHARSAPAAGSAVRPR